jgi:FKBP-type peptidyl-prolyl cis-trans isomerase FkpA
MNRTKRLIAGLPLLILIVLLHGCGESRLERERQEALEQEALLLEKYLEENGITQEPTASGLYYIPLNEGTGDQVDLEDYVDFNFVVELIDGTVLFTSYEDIAEGHSLYSDDVLYGPIRWWVGHTGIPGWDEGVQFMREGGKATLIMPSSINGFGSASTALSPSYSTHIWTVDLIHAFDDPESFEDEQISLYLQENQIDSIHITESGLYFLEILAGEGDPISDGDIVKVWYTGRFLDGRVFDSNVGGTALTVVLPATGNYIPAWDEALRLMQEGTQAMIIVPYELGYDEEGYYPIIPPYKTLIFDMEVESVDSGS